MSFFCRSFGHHSERESKLAVSSLVFVLAVVAGCLLSFSSLSLDAALSLPVSFFFLLASVMTWLSECGFSIFVLGQHMPENVSDEMFAFEQQKREVELALSLRDRIAPYVELTSSSASSKAEGGGVSVQSDAITAGENEWRTKMRLQAEQLCHVSTGEEAEVKEKKEGREEEERTRPVDAW